jgi:hypothetical protein
LQPKTFHFYTQQKPGADASCLVLFIQTNGKEGKIAPLDPYPITDGNSAALRVSEAVLFGGVVPLSPDTGLSMSGSQDGGNWCTIASGNIDAG